MSLTYTASADLSSSENLAVKDDGDGQAALATAGSDKLIGVIKDGGTASGDPVSVYADGEVGYCKLGGTVNGGDYLTATTGSKLIATTTDTNEYVGKALEDGVTNDIIRFRALLGRYAG